MLYTVSTKYREARSIALFALVIFNDVRWYKDYAGMDSNTLGDHSGESQHLLRVDDQEASELRRLQHHFLSDFPEKSWRCYRTRGGLDDYLNLILNERLAMSEHPIVVADGWYPSLMHYRTTMPKRAWENWSYWWENFYADHYEKEMEIYYVEQSEVQ